MFNSSDGQVRCVFLGICFRWLKRQDRLIFHVIVGVALDFSQLSLNYARLHHLRLDELITPITQLARGMRN